MCVGGGVVMAEWVQGSLWGEGNVLKPDRGDDHTAL